MENRRGFTIIELLIVIVVIAILSAIGIVMYGSIQKRAANTAMEARLNDWTKVFNLYKSQKGGYPLTDIEVPGVVGGSQTGYYCLGDPAEYPQTPDIPAGYCRGTNGAAWGRAADTVLMNAVLDGVKSAMSSLPKLNYAPVPWGVYKDRGMVYENMSLDGNGNRITRLRYFYYGNGCVQGDQLQAYDSGSSTSQCFRQLR